ncbi:four helix bundle protein [Fibrella aestuarina]|uniref:four helix bundle protein n=1 Tax=Fibrella aestuarina TaxID=651143 RepID=UPI000A06730D|nr:four helix bundle protein [Fibrella aestuarina]
MDAINDDLPGDDHVGEAPADYASYSKSQFLDDITRRLNNLMLRCLNVCRSLPESFEAQHFSRQLIRASSSAAANFRAVRRGRSGKEYFAKLSLVIEELDECLFWLETLINTQLVSQSRLSDLIDEGYQLLKILSKSRKTASD